MDLDDELESLKDLPKRPKNHAPPITYGTDGKPFFHTGNHGQKPQSIIITILDDDDDV